MRCWMARAARRLYVLIFAPNQKRRGVRFGSWLCKNALAEALTSGDPGAVAGCGDFPEYCGFFVQELLLIGMPAVLGGSAMAEGCVSAVIMPLSPP